MIRQRKLVTGSRLLGTGLLHHATKELIEKYKGQFDDGWLAYREATFGRQKAMGVTQQGWDRARIDELVASGKMKRVTLEKPMRVFVVYNTVRVPDADGRVHFRLDVYQRDAAVLAVLESPFRLHAKAG